MIIAILTIRVEHLLSTPLLGKNLKMRNLFSFIIFLSLVLVCADSFSQGKISLVILDNETQKPLPDAKVEIFNSGRLEKSAITSDNGRIAFDVSDTRELDLIISKPGYNKLMICEFKLTNNKKAEIYGALSKGSALQYAKGSYLTTNKKKVLKTSKRAFVRF